MALADIQEVAHDSPDLGAPVKIGGKATAAAPAAVNDGDRVDANFSLTGAQRVEQGALASATDTVTTTTNQTTIGNGHKEVTTAGTAVALASSTSCKRVTIQAYRANTGFIIVGGTGVNGSSSIGTGTGASLAAGESISFDINNLATIFIDSTVNGEGVRYIYLN